MWGIELAIMFAMIAINSVFAAYEIALTSVGLARLRGLADEGRAGAHVACYMKENMEASLAVVQLGITLVGAVAAAVGGAGAEVKLAPALIARFGLSPGTAEVLAIALVVLPLTVVTIIFGELVPKVFALRNAEWVSLGLSPLMRWFAFSVWPAVWLFEITVTGIMSWGARHWRPGGQSETSALQELRGTAALARASRLIGPREERIILGASRLGSRRVGEIMLPAEHIRTLELGGSLTDNLIAAHRDMHTRFPVVERPGDVQSIVGYVNLKDLVFALRVSPREASVRGVLRPLPSLKHEAPIAAALEQIMADRSHMALVRDGAGQVVGMITLEDIIEELVGEIEDEYDRLPTHVVASGQAWVVGGGASPARVRQATGIDLPFDSAAPAPATLHQWLAQALGDEVRGGAEVVREGVHVQVRKVRRGKLQEALVRRG